MGDRDLEEEWNNATVGEFAEEFYASFEDAPVRSPCRDPATVAERGTTLSPDVLSDAVLRNVWEDSFYLISLNSQCDSGGDYCPISALDGLNAESEYLDAYYFDCFLNVYPPQTDSDFFPGAIPFGSGKRQVETVDPDHEFSARCLMDILRDTGLPFYYDGEGGRGPIVWDDGSNTLRVHSYCRVTTTDIEAKNYYEEKDMEMSHLLSRCRITSDHGQKPLLISRELGNLVKDGQQVEFQRPEFIDQSRFDQYELAFLDASGSVQTIALDRAARLKIPIHTRTCIYDVHEDGLITRFNYAYLLGSAFKLAATVPPKRMGCFQIKSSGTIFQPSIVGLELPGIITTGSTQELVDSLRSQTEKAGDVYLTSGLHPFDEYSHTRILGYEHWVTTLELYEKAVKKIEESGFHCSAI